MKLWAKAAAACAFALVYAVSARGQGARFDDIALRAMGTGGVTYAPGATITVCTSAGTGTPCTPLVPVSPVTLCTDSTCSTAGTNPFTADGLGNFGFWALPGTYKVTITGAGLTGYTKTVVLPITLSGNNAFTGNNTHSGTETFTGLVSCKNLGSIRCVDSANSAGWSGTDFGSWINAAYADLPSSGGKIMVAGGSYTWSTVIAINTANKVVGVEGVGPASTITWPATTGTAATVNWGGSHVPAPLFRNLQFIGPGSGTSTTFLLIGSTGLTDQVAVEHCIISGWGTGITTGGASTGFDLTFANNTIQNNGTGILVPQNAVPIRLVNNTVATNTTGINITGGAATLVLVGNDIEPNCVACTGIAMSGNSYIHGFGNHFETVAGFAFSQFINGTATNGRLNLYAGEMWDDNTSGTLGQFVTWKGDQIVLDGVTVWAAAGRTVTQAVNFTASFDAAYLKLINVANGTISAPYGGTLPGTLFSTSTSLNGQWTTALDLTFFPISAVEGAAPSGIAGRDFLYPDSTAHRWKMNNNNGGADTIVGTATSDTLANKTFSDTVPAKRFKASQGTVLVAGDFALSAGWGTTPSVSAVAATDQGGRINITSGTGTPTANPTVTLTFKDGTWTNAPGITASRGDVASPTTGFWALTTISATAATWTFVGTPAVSTVYALDFVCMGR